jgi:hypothetical protein
VPCHKCQTRRLTVGQCQGLEESIQPRGGPRGPRKRKNPDDFPKSDKPQDNTKKGPFYGDDGGAGGYSGIST